MFILVKKYYFSNKTGQPKHGEAASTTPQPTLLRLKDFDTMLAAKHNVSGDNTKVNQLFTVLTILFVEKKFVFI
jgi:hypothetical protein